jgi:hypothetical protein
MTAGARRRGRPCAAGAAVLVLCAIGAVPAAAQVRASERARVSQTVAGTTITLDYARPRLRGRSPIFGGLVHWGEVWTPGANMATTLETDRDIAIDGHQVPEGRYSVWLVVERVGPWTLVLDPDADRFHTSRPRERPEQIRFPVEAQAAPETEVLTWSFPDISATGTTAVLQWADRAVRLPITVAPRAP